MGFLLDDSCPVAPPCDCAGTGPGSFRFVGVICADKSLTSVPTFRNISYRMSEPWTIDLHRNNISNIPDNAFSNLQEYANGNNVSVRLGMNNLGNISDSAFSGIESMIIFVGLARNHLEVMPSFVLNLPNLKGLDVLFNPISYIDPSTFMSLRSLKTLMISVGDLPLWPKSLNSLSELETLEIETNHSNIPGNAFTGLNNTLRYLSTINVDLFNATALCGLSVLEKLNIYSSDITGDNILNCALPMTSTKYIELQNLASNRFIDFLGIFPDVERLEYFDAGLSFIDESLIPTGVKVKDFTCDNCKLKSIPGAINLFSLLESCDLQANGITTIERYSFDNLQHLHEIELDFNPIIYISRFAFRNLANLQTLSLLFTKLTIIPQAVMTLPNLQYLDLDSDLGLNITCACGPLWMKQWATSMTQKPHVYIMGRCHTPSETLNHFVLHTLPNCP